MPPKHQPVFTPFTQTKPRAVCAPLALLFSFAVARTAAADQAPQNPPVTAPPVAPRPVTPPPLTGARSAYEEGNKTEGPPPQAIRYLQYGVAFTVELPTVTDGYCNAGGATPCVLGSGGGIALHLGWRSAGRWYFGGAVEVSKQDPSKLLLLAFLKQARAEARYYVDMSKDTQPFLLFGAGLAGYGGEWDISSWGPVGVLGLGIETQLSTAFVASVTIGYRPMFLTRLDLPGVSAGPGFVHMFAMEFAVEAKDPR